MSLEDNILGVFTITSLCTDFVQYASLVGKTGIKTSIQTVDIGRSYLDSIVVHVFIVNTFSVEARRIYR